MKPKIFLLLRWVSLLRPAPLELPQGGNAARVESCSGAIKVAYPLFILSMGSFDNGFNLFRLFIKEIFPYTHGLSNNFSKFNVLKAIKL
jgi:hypothetical protein